MKFPWENLAILKPTLSILLTEKGGNSVARTGQHADRLLHTFLASFYNVCFPVQFAK